MRQLVRETVAGTRLVEFEPCFRKAGDLFYAVSDHPFPWNRIDSDKRCWGVKAVAKIAVETIVPPEEVQYVPDVVVYVLHRANAVHVHHTAVAVHNFFHMAVAAHDALHSHALHTAVAVHDALHSHALHTAVAVLHTEVFRSSDQIRAVDSNTLPAAVVVLTEVSLKNVLWPAAENDHHCCCVLNS